MHTILVVDDEPSNISIVSNILGDHYKILACTSGEKAFEVLNKSSVNLILLDILMPEMDGFEVCAKIKEHDRFKHIPVIFISALSSLEDRLKGFNVGANDFLSKPINPDEVFSKIQIEIENSIKSYRQKLEIKNLEENVNSSNSTIHELELICDFLIELLSLKNVDNIINLLVQLLKNLNFSNIVSITLPNDEYQFFSNGEEITSMATSILDKAREKNMNLLFNDKLVVHKNIFTVLITNMPKDDTTHCERIENNLNKILNATNIALANI